MFIVALTYFEVCMGNVQNLDFFFRIINQLVHGTGFPRSLKGP